MEFKALVQARRSVRSFEATEVTDEQIASIIDAGLWAPSPLNLQPWEFIVVSDPEIKKLPDVAIRDRNLVPVEVSIPGLRVDRCLCNGASPSVVLPIFFVKSMQ